MKASLNCERSITGHVTRIRTSRMCVIIKAPEKLLPVNFQDRAKTSSLNGTMRNMPVSHHALPEIVPVIAKSLSQYIDNH